MFDDVDVHVDNDDDHNNKSRHLIEIEIQFYTCVAFIKFDNGTAQN